jgi:hypothetical protein
MLNCIVDMVGKTKRAINVLQTKTVQFHRHSDNYESELKRKQTELMATTIKQAEDKVNEIKRKAEDAVTDIKKQASAELQKAMIAAEQKASDIIKRERDHFEKVMHDARKKVKEEILSKSVVSQAVNSDEVA